MSNEITSEAGGSGIDVPPPLLPYGTQPSRRGRGFVAVCGDWLFPGLGHWMVGAGRRGLVWFAILVALNGLGLAAVLRLPRLMPVLLFTVPASAISFLWMLVDAYRCGRRSTGRVLGSPVLRYVTGLLLLAASNLATRPVVRGLQALGPWSFVTPSDSMKPTIRAGDRFFVARHQPVGRWDVVIVIPPGRKATAQVRRVVGLPGETVEILTSGVVTIDGKPIALPPGAGPYMARDVFGHRIIPGPGCEGNPIHLAADEYYVLGDNSPIAGDARYWPAAVPGHQTGALPADHIVGRVTGIYWPPARWRMFR